MRDENLAAKRISSCFETEPLGFRDQPWFLNIALEIDTRLSPAGLLRRCMEVERSLGRVRPFPSAPRTLDLDILLYGDRVLNTDNLIIPHPRMAERRFVLEPLSEIASQVLHPVLKESIHSLLTSCRDASIVRFYCAGDSL